MPDFAGPAALTPLFSPGALIESCVTVVSYGHTITIELLMVLLYYSDLLSCLSRRLYATVSEGRAMVGESAEYADSCR